jgi:hypothetical protein
LAASRGLGVEHRWELAPNVGLEDLLVLLVDLPDTTLVCTHREIFETLFGRDVTCEKGAIWVAERSGPELVPREYLEPPAAVTMARDKLLSSN